MFSTLLDGTTLTVRSPDQKIVWELENGRNVQVWFEDGAYTYRGYTDASLGQQLAGLFKAMWEAHRRAHLTVLSDMVGQTVRDNTAGDGRDQVFLEERAKVQASGASNSRRVQLRATGMTNWEVNIKQGTNRQLDQEKFLFEVWEAFSSLMSDYRSKMARLKRDIYPSRTYSRPLG